VRVRAYAVGVRIDPKKLDLSQKLSPMPLVLPVGQGCAVVFRYGVVVLFDVPTTDHEDFLGRIAPAIGERFGERSQEDVEIGLGPSGQEWIEDGTILLEDFAIERIQLVAAVLARCVVLTHYEMRIHKVFDRLEPIARELEARGNVAERGKELMQQIGGALLVQHHMVGRAQVAEKPDLLWDRPDLDRLYNRLTDEYELVERDKALDRQLDLVASTAHTLLELIHARRSLHLEWYVVILIVAELFLGLYEAFVR
jgi:uncharacterized Rmd1/YagE family protein